MSTQVAESRKHNCALINRSLAVNLDHSTPLISAIYGCKLETTVVILAANPDCSIVNKYAKDALSVPPMDARLAAQNEQCKNLVRAHLAARKRAEEAAAAKRVEEATVAAAVAAARKKVEESASPTRLVQSSPSIERADTKASAGNVQHPAAKSVRVSLSV